MTCRRALITGVTGFIGSNLANRLIAEGWYVGAIVRPESNISQIKFMLNKIKIYQYDGTILSLQTAINDFLPDVVFHLASLASLNQSEEDIGTLLDANIIFGAKLLEAMRKEGVTNFINTGTVWQHYEGKQYSPVNLYAATKQAFEVILQYYVEAHKLKAITLTLSDTYGPKDPRDKLINLLLDGAKNRSVLEMTPGHQLISLTHITDVISAYLSASELLISSDIDYYKNFTL